jgi:hypothetical protein
MQRQQQQLYSLGAKTETISVAADLINMYYKSIGLLLLSILPQLLFP